MGVLVIGILRYVNHLNFLVKPRPQGLLAIMKAEHSRGGDWKEQTRGHSNHACVELKIQDGGQHTSETDR